MVLPKVPKLKKSKARGYNPTLESIKEDVNGSPQDLRNRYSPYIVDRKHEESKKIYKRSASFMLNMNQMTLTVTDTPYTLFGREYDHISKFKRSQDVQFPDSIVCFAFRTINKPDDDLKAFCLDIPAFLHIFSRPDVLKEKMLAKAFELADVWTRDNGAASMKGKRNADERVISLDYRQNSKSAGVSEIVMAATSIAFTVLKQNEPGEVTCSPQDITFHMRYQIPAEQSSDGKSKPKSGMIKLAFNEWDQLFDNTKLLDIYNETWEKYPLPQSYSKRLEEYNLINNTEEKDDPNPNHTEEKDE